MTTTPGAALRRGTGGDRRPDRARGPLPTRVSETPTLPESFESVLDAGLLELGLDLTPDVRRAIAGHARLLLAWTRAINLTAIREPAEMARLHVLDSLAAAPLLRAVGADSVLDLGSGGGYPGIPLALVLGGRAMLVDSVGRKARFLETVVDAIGVGERVAVAAERAEALARGADRGRWPLVTARAVGSLAELIEIGLPLAAVGGRLLAWKRGDLGTELAAARRAGAALGGVEIRVHEVAVAALPGHRLVEVVKTAPSPEAFPRSPALRARRPWAPGAC
ncbi:MAG TPA: 16S rRNA (guanine(527)-N(7))-methyltransferase RsmG [Candidatus Limnocylindrales bacterium]|nr:16S rRNA (guanine(527)-N(7))-methyltransferase RsmG [Candidatus Limnocylindrales bacterium]